MNNKNQEKFFPIVKAEKIRLVLQEGEQIKLVLNFAVTLNARRPVDEESNANKSTDWGCGEGLVGNAVPWPKDLSSAKTETTFLELLLGAKDDCTVCVLTHRT